MQNWQVSLNDAPRGRLRFVAICGILLVGANLLGANPYVDPDALTIEIQWALGLGVLALTLADYLTPAARRAWRHRAILVTASVLIAVGSAEAGARWLYRHVASSADGGAYFSRQWVRRGYVHRNALGFRERAFSMAKPPGVYRIAVLGDSLTFGNGLRSEERYSDRLQQWLPKRVEVLNFGVGGDNTPQHLNTLRTHVLPANPDFVLLQWFTNDIEGDDVERRPGVWRLMPFATAHHWLSARSALYTVANMRWGEMQIAAGMTRSYGDYLRARAGDPNSDDARREAELLTRIIDECRHRGRSIGIVLFPDLGAEPGERYPYAYLHDRVLELCLRNGVPCLDLRDTFAATRDRRSLWVSQFDHHPSARANEIAALKILEVFGTEWQKP